MATHIPFRIITALSQCALVFWAARSSILSLNDTWMLLALAVLEWTGLVLDEWGLCSWLPGMALLTFGMLVALGAPCTSSTVLVAAILAPKLAPLFLRLFLASSTLTPHRMLADLQLWPPLAAIVGAFAGAWFLPLDWHAVWQKWPGPVVLLSQLGYSLFLLPCIFKGKSKGKRSKQRK